MNGRFIQKISLILLLALLLFLVSSPHLDKFSKDDDMEHQIRVKLSTSESNNVSNTSSARLRSNSNGKKKILAWTKIFGKDFLIYNKWKALTSELAFSQCPVYKSCEWTTERSAVDQVDAVVFHIFPKDFSLKDLPTHREPHQNWVFLNLEPPQRFQGW